MKNIPYLGAGLGFRTELKPYIFLHRNEIDFLEITADHYLDAPAEKMQELALLKNHFTLIPHALNLSLGSASGLDPIYLEKLAKLIAYLNPPYWSEHICYSNAHGLELGHLAPLPRTDAMLDVLARNIEEAQKRIPLPLVLENITYHVNLPGHQYSEPVFINKLLEATDCGLLLDITNLFVNSLNHNFSWMDYLDDLDMKKIIQMHFVGIEKHGTTWIDNHGTNTAPELFYVMQEVINRSQVKGIILERDENFPEFEILLQEVAYARQLLNQK